MATTASQRGVPSWQVLWGLVMMLRRTWVGPGRSAIMAAAVCEGSQTSSLGCGLGVRLECLCQPLPKGAHVSPTPKRVTIITVIIALTARALVFSR